MCDLICDVILAVFEAAIPENQKKRENMEIKDIFA